MSEAKPFASLSSGLLARKGAAKPAMRRPNINVNPNIAQEDGQDDLGWNDMGYDVDPDLSKETPSVKAVNPLEKAIETPKPEVKQQQDRIAEQLRISNEADIEKSSSKDAIDGMSVHQNEQPAGQQIGLQNIDDKGLSSLKTKPAPRKSRVSKKSLKAKAKAAFTLRLDPERHLKLRLACAIENISAQKFVTDALDKKLSEMNQIDHLSGQIVEK